MMDETLKNKLHALYADDSKHAVYQNVPQFVHSALGYTEKINENWRGDTARWVYLESKLDFAGRRVLDVGANTGFFALSLAEQYPDADLTALEGNENHARFISEVADAFALNNVSVLSQYLSLDAIDGLAEFDDILLFNVLHHAGADFDTEKCASPSELFDYLVMYLKKLSSHTQRVVFQMGYNWGGNKQAPIVPLEDDTGKIIYTSRAFLAAGYQIKDIAPAFSIKGAIPAENRSLSSEIIDAVNRKEWIEVSDLLHQELDSELPNQSEFYRRALFVCESPLVAC